MDLYVDYLLNQACKEPFSLFSEGFHRVLKSDILSLFNATELMTLVAGKVTQPKLPPKFPEVFSLRRPVE